jgi:hypothetical protein
MIFESIDINNSEPFDNIVVSSPDSNKDNKNCCSLCCCFPVSVFHIDSITTLIGIKCQNFVHLMFIILNQNLTL